MAANDRSKELRPFVGGFLVLMANPPKKIATKKPVLMNVHKLPGLIHVSDPTNVVAIAMEIPHPTAVPMLTKVPDASRTRHTKTFSGN